MTDKLQALRDFADELHSRIDYSDYSQLRDLIDALEPDDEPDPPSYTCECCGRPTNTLYVCKQILEGHELCFECMNTELSGEAQRRLKSWLDLTAEENRFGDFSTLASVETDQQRRRLWEAFEVRCVANEDGRCE